MAFLNLFSLLAKIVPKKGTEFKKKSHLFDGSSGGGCRGSTTSSGSWGGSGTGSNVGNEVLDVDGLEALGEKAGPERLNGDVSGLQDGVDLLSLKRK